MTLIVTLSNHEKGGSELPERRQIHNQNEEKTMKKLLLLTMLLCGNVFAMPQGWNMFESPIRTVHDINENSVHRHSLLEEGENNYRAMQEANAFELYNH